MNKLLLLFSLFISFSFFAQQRHSYNFGFENQYNTKAIGWDNFGDDKALIVLDSTVKHSGNFSIRISELDKSETIKGIKYSIPATFSGKKLKLSGYIKTENVENGYAGLVIQINPQGTYTLMAENGIKGTQDWKKYEVELEYEPHQADTIFIGGHLVGSGKVWLDDFELKVDGKLFYDASEKELSAIQKDKEFDTGSGIFFETLNDQQIENLTVLGKVWGFLKYHHPSVAKGGYNWDYELFRVMDKIANASSNKIRDEEILKWISKYGDIPKCRKCEPTAEDSPLKPDHRWITQEIVSKELQEKLLFIYENRFQGNNFFVGKEATENVKFLNENPYPYLKYPDSGFRLLSLFRFWNMFQYFSPYREITDKDWNDVLKEYIPKYIAAKNELEYEIAVIHLLGEVQDTHTNLWGGNDKYQKLLGDFYAPVKVDFIENQLVVMDYFNPEMKDKVGLEIGDIITSINGRPISEIVDEKLPDYPASNLPTKLRDLAINILRSNDKEILISVQRNDETLEKTLPLFTKENLDFYKWYKVNIDEPSHKMLPGNIGYVSLANIKEEDVEIIKETMKDAKGIIIDIRNYPSDFVVFRLGKFFASESTAIAKFSIPVLNNPGEFEFKNYVRIGSSEKNRYKGKVVILVNEITQSQAEYTAMALKASPNSVVIGSTTAGADGNVSKILLPGYLGTWISGLGVFYPDGKPTQRIGIIPDIEVKPTVNGIREGRDELLEKAIEVINK